MPSSNTMTSLETLTLTNTRVIMLTMTMQMNHQLLSRT